ncbi:hypothetical protein B0T24DRAFT_698095 [Lasiosphaeria ovina]|uniref:Uncharacterized protein n=1 Tax=Lasiosphaeria ovina TaxID=92902 RepID=A0AAE0N9G0_9PEZI|nr:hypothetical protein B0T24DRAFT_698095 [Lasiosphaeria ovina]
MEPSQRTADGAAPSQLAVFWRVAVEKHEQQTNIKLACCSAQIFYNDRAYRDDIRAVIQQDVDDGEWKANPWNALFVEQFSRGKAKTPRKLFVLDGVDQLTDTERRKLFAMVGETEDSDVQILFVLAGTPRSWTGQDFAPQSFRPLAPGIELARPKVHSDLRRVAEVHIEASQWLCRLMPRLKADVADKITKKADCRLSFIRARLPVSDSAESATDTGNPGFVYIDHIVRRLDSIASSRLVENSVDKLPDTTTAICNELLDGCGRLYDESERSKLGYLFAWLTYTQGETNLSSARVFLSDILGASFKIEDEVTSRLAKILTLSDRKDDPNEQSDYFPDEDDLDAAISLSFQDQYLREHFRGGGEDTSSLRLSLRRLGFEFQPERSLLSVPLAIMRRRVGSADTFFGGVEATFAAKKYASTGDDAEVQPNAEAYDLKTVSDTSCARYCYAIRKKLKEPKGLGSGTGPSEAEAEACVDDNEKASHIDVCPWGHAHIKAPVDGWKDIRQGRLLYGDVDVAFGSWLEQLEGKWAVAWERYWTHEPTLPAHDLDVPAPDAGASSWLLDSELLAGI